MSNIRKSSTATIISAVNDDKFNHRHIGYLFARISAIYPHTWGGHESDKWAEMRKEWSDALSKYKFDVVMRAIDELRKTNTVYPPTLPQFVALCDKHSPKQFCKIQLAASSREPSALLAKFMAEHPETISTESINKAKSWLDMIRNKLNSDNTKEEQINISILRP